MSKKSFLLKKTWVDIKTGKEKGGYFCFYSDAKYDKFKFYKTLGKQTTFNSLKDAKAKIKLFDLKGVKIIEV